VNIFFLSSKTDWEDGILAQGDKIIAALCYKYCLNLGPVFSVFKNININYLKTIYIIPTINSYDSSDLN